MLILPAQCTRLRIKAQPVAPTLLVRTECDRYSYSKADMAMYAAKRAGKGRYVVCEEGMRGALLARLDLESDLRRALEQHEFVVH